MNPIPKNPPKRATVRQTSDRVSSDSAKLLALGGRFFHERADGGFEIREQVTRVVKAALASCVNQDQRKGRRVVTLPAGNTVVSGTIKVDRGVAVRGPRTPKKSKRARGRG